MTMEKGTDNVVPDGIVEDILVSTNSITDLMKDEVNKCIRTVLYIAESNWRQKKDAGGVPEFQPDPVKNDPRYQAARKAVLDGFNDYNRFMIFRVLNPLYEQHNESVYSMDDKIKEQAQTIKKLRAEMKELKAK